MTFIVYNQACVFVMYPYRGIVPYTWDTSRCDLAVDEVDPVYKKTRWRNMKKQLRKVIKMVHKGDTHMYVTISLSLRLLFLI